MRFFNLAEIVRVNRREARIHCGGVDGVASDGEAVYVGEGDHGGLVDHDIGVVVVVGRMPNGWS